MDTCEVYDHDRFDEADTQIQQYKTLDWVHYRLYGIQFFFLIFI